MLAYMFVLFLDHFKSRRKAFRHAADSLVFLQITET